jgi:hypothetical protein
MPKKKILSAWNKHVRAVKAKNPNLSFKRMIAKAKKTYNKGSKTVRKTTKTKQKKGKRTMAKKKRRSSRKFTLPLAPVAGLAAGLITPIQQAISGNYDNAFRSLVANYTGVENAGTSNAKFAPKYLVRGLLPLVAGLVVHKVVGGMLGINRILGRAKVPVLRI